MRLWAIHPGYLDSKGLVALWREALLAKNVIEGNTRGYTRHPQLQKFIATGNAELYIHKYLEGVWAEADTRGYNFDKNKFKQITADIHLAVTTGQQKYEFRHLMNKLQSRDPERFERLVHTTKIKLHPLFIPVPGKIADWEIIK